MNPEADSTGLFNRGLRGFDGWKRISSCYIRDIRVIRGSILLLLALFCSVAFADAESIPAPVEASLLANTSGLDLDSLDCITADDSDEEPLLANGNPTRLPGGPEQLPSVSADRAHVSPRYDQETPQTTTTILDPIVLRQPGIIPAFLFSTHFPDSLREQLRERAPPSLT